MPMSDVTVDTNVLMHASNPQEARYASALEFVTKLMQCETNLAIDSGFDVDPAKNRSLIGHEYLNRLVMGNIGYALVAHLAQTGRVRSVVCKVPSAVSKKLNQMVSNKRDRTFVRVGINSEEKALISHDFQDFSANIRQQINSELNLLVLEAEEALDNL